MRLYSHITNEKNSGVQKGGNKKILITLNHETSTGSWETSTEEISITFLWNEGKPQLSVILPKSWAIDQPSRDYTQAFHFISKEKIT